MSGLVEYNSSDDDEDDMKGVKAASIRTATAYNLQLSSSHLEGNNESSHTSTRCLHRKEDNPNGQIQIDSISTSKEAPQLPSSSNDYPIGPSAETRGDRTNNEDTSAPQSPYLVSRAIMRDLTLPTIPNLDIPLSPPGSPPPGVDKRFGHFLKLKMQGVHFNEKLARSSALKNPSLLRKLMDSAGIEDYDQYESTLPNGKWNPASFPSWAYKEELAKSQQEVTKKKEEERARTQRESIEFISAANPGDSSRNAALFKGVRPRGLKGSAAERVMAAGPAATGNLAKQPLILVIIVEGQGLQYDGDDQDRDS
ncbi:hypothetical protein MMC14_007989 [Varicellaria rhodocarpa]|nr:hypothetical protein [Varicellaria rhodocarpa]